MDEETGIASRTAVSLSRPDKERAAHIARELSWSERIDGEIFDAGPGTVTQRIYRLEALSSLLDNLPNFSVDFGTLEEWTSDTLGDVELAEAIGTLVKESAEQGAKEEPGELRNRIAEVIRGRVAQCVEVLHDSEQDPAAVGAVTEKS